MRLRNVSIAAVLATSFASDVYAAQPAQDEELTADQVLDAVDDALEEAADAVAETTRGDAAEVSVEDSKDDGLWKPVTYYDPLIDEFLADATPIAEGKATTRQAVAAKYGMSEPALDETIAFLRAMERDGYNKKQKGGLRSRALRLVEITNRAPIALMFGASAIDHVSDKCTPDDIDLLMKGSRSPDKDLWAIVTSCSSSEAFTVALERPSAARPALSYLAKDWTSTDQATELAAIDMLLRPEFLVQVDESQRSEVQADLVRQKLSTLLSLGLFDEALAFGDSLNSSVRNQALKEGSYWIRAKIGGFRMKTGGHTRPSIASDYAAALALAGRRSEAQSVLELVAPAAKRWAARSCLDAAKDQCQVGHRNGDVPLAALMVDHFLDRPKDDPYVLIESQIGFSSSRDSTAAELLCRLDLTAEDRKECDRSREALQERRADRGDQEEEGLVLWAAIRKNGGQAFEAARASYAAKLGTIKPAGEVKKDWTRESVEPAPVPFRELPLPAAALARKPTAGADPNSFADLPPGYAPVRFERSGQRAAAISLSTRFDPNGEVSGGGYWLHLSDDGGKSWQPPLYTGLAEYFPYIVAAKARLPMLAGDTIQLEVEEALIDTASISYPPVGMALKRKRKNIYLEIPIADLTKDSDGDGLSDIAARHLLLDQPATSGTPFIVGQERDCAAPHPDTLARLEILKKLFAMEARALIEPVGPKKELISGWKRSGPSEKPPIFLMGNPDDYRCVVLDRPMIVYSEADRERLRKYSPDFQLITLPPIRWNRDHTRGFVNWSMGWAGGTFRLVRRDGGWKLESISEWIT